MVCKPSGAKMPAKTPIEIVSAILEGDSSSFRISEK